MDERWRDIPGFDGHYQVSDCGRVKSLKFGKERIMKGGHIGRGYPSVLLTKNGQPSTHYIHRLVAKAFLPTDDERPHVNHIDGDRENNHVTNLEWCTHTENIAHARDVLGVMGGNLGYRKLSESEREQIAELRRRKISPRVIADLFGVAQATIQGYMRELAPDVRYISKLSDADVPQIYAMRAAGMTLKQIAAEFGVTDSLICRVLKGNRRNRQERAS